MKVVAIDAPGYGPWDREQRALQELGGDFEVVSYEELCGRASECDALVNGGGWPLPASLLDQLGPCGLIVGFGTGVDWIDVGDAHARGIVVARTPHANVEDVATHSLALILACARRVLESDAQVRLGDFDLTMYRPIHRLRGRRLALLSFGNIPRRLRALVEPLGVEVRSYDPLVPGSVMRAHDVEPAELDELLRWADILSVHTPATAATMGLLGEPELRRLRPGAIVVITSRGGVYDARALARLLEDGHVASAGLDVFPEEPLPPGHPLLSAPRTVLTPHSAGYSEGALDDYHAEAIAALTTFFAGGTPRWVVTRDQPQAAVGRSGG